ncbi:MAG: hypothetical protein ACI4LX_09970 [Treponema sp.]
MDRDDIVKKIKEGHFEQIEKELKSDFYTNSEKSFYYDLLFTKELECALAELEKGNWDYVNKIISKDWLEQKHLEKLFLTVHQLHNLQTIMENTNYRLPVNNYYGNDTLALMAVREQCYDLLNWLINNGADLQLTDKENRYNPLFLSINFDNKNTSINIFKLLLEHTDIKSDVFKADEYGNKWYVTKMITANQFEMMKYFFEKENALNSFLETEDCLKDVCYYSCIFDYCNESDLLKIKNIDAQYDYFSAALDGCNAKAIRLLMKLTVSPVITDKKFIDSFFTSSHTNGEIIWQGKFSDGYHDILALKPELDLYVKKWCEKENQ